MQDESPTHIAVNADLGSVPESFTDSEAYYQPSVRGTQLEAGYGQPQKDSAEQAAQIRVRLPRPKQMTVATSPMSRLIPLQTWEGFVEGVNWEEGTFSARLQDLEVSATGEAERAELPISDIHQDDLELLQVGSVFRWVIGYREEAGTRERVSGIVFRRLPAWTESDLRHASEEGQRLANAIQWG